MSDTTDELRPATLDEFHGQPEAVGQLTTVLRAAAERGEVADHILLSGPPGLGKTTLAVIAARTLGVPHRLVAAPSMERPADIAGVLMRLPDDGSVLFVDEIHALDSTAEELLYPAMEDRRLDILTGTGPSARTRSLPLPPFTLVGATTDSGKLTAPLRSRFGLALRLRPYPADALQAIISQSAARLSFDLDQDAARVIAERSQGTPRIANNLLRRVRDWAQLHHDGPLGADGAAQALDAFDVDEHGLTSASRHVLECLANAGRPVGLAALATAVGEPTTTVEREIEPWLVQLGLISRTRAGRVLTHAGYAHLSLDPPASPSSPPRRRAAAPRSPRTPTRGQMPLPQHD